MNVKLAFHDFHFYFWCGMGPVLGSKRVGLCNADKIDFSTFLASVNTLRRKPLPCLKNPNP
jgi:hypothetical protein